MKAGVGLDLGSATARLAVVRTGRSGTELLAYASVPLAINDEFSDLVDPLTITSTIKSLLRGVRLPKGPVCLGLADQRMVAREVDIPWVPDKELKSALPMLASDLLPMPVEESVLDFLPAEEVVDKDGSRSLHGLLLAANEEIVTTTVEAVEHAGLQIDRVDFGPLGALQAVCDPLASGAEALLDVGGSTTTLVVHEGPRPTFVRVMAKGGDSITESLAQQFSLSTEDARRWKHGVGQLWLTMSADDQVATRHALDTAAGPLLEEIRSSVMFYQTTVGTRIERLWITGGSSVQFGLDYQLRDSLHIDVRRAMPMARLSGNRAGEAVVAEQTAAATAIGLAMAVAA